MHRLKYESRERMYGLKEPDEVCSTSIGSWHIHEVYRPDVHSGIKPGLGAYRVVLEADVENIPDLLRLHQEGIALCDEFEKAFIYVWGTPLQAFGWGNVISLLEPPSGWSTNYTEVNKALQTETQGIFARIEVEHQQWMFGPGLPLKHAIRVREKIAGLTDEALQALIDFHHCAHHPGTSIEASVFFLSKGLEIAREMLPSQGKKDTDLPQHVRGALTQPLHRLSGAANNYLETRHAVRDKRSLALHPRLGSGLLPFVQDVDLVLRTVVCGKLREAAFVIGRDGK